MEKLYQNEEKSPSKMIYELTIYSAITKVEKCHWKIV